MSEPEYVTMNELNAKLDERPTRWEVRFLILAGFLGAQVVAAFVPTGEVAKAALPFL